MAIVINGSGTVTGLAVGGLPDDTVDAGTLANSINTEITANTAKTGITSSQATAITAALPKAGGTLTGAVIFNSTMTLGASSYWKGGTNGYRFNNAADSVNLLIIKDDGRGLSQFTAKAWANWNGTGTLAIRDSHNISSVSDYGTGWYAPTYANSMANTNYGVYACGSYNNSNRSRSVSGRVQNAGSAEVFSQADNTATDNADCYVLVFGD